MPDSPIDNFANELSAGMSHKPVSQYISDHEDLINKIQRIEEIAKTLKVRTIDEYNKAMTLKSALSSLYCYTFNNNKTEFDKVSDLEGQVGSKLAGFARCFQRAKGEKGTLIRYVLWGRRYRDHNVEKIIAALADSSHLYKKDNRYYVTGLHLAVGDNVFTVSRTTGREYRNYVRTCVIEAFPVSSYWDDMMTHHNITAPILPDYYHIIYIGDGKECAKISFSRKDKCIIERHYC